MHLQILTRAHITCWQHLTLSSMEFSSGILGHFEVVNFAPTFLLPTALLFFWYMCRQMFCVVDHSHSMQSNFTRIHCFWFFQLLPLQSWSKPIMSVFHTLPTTVFQSSGLMWVQLDNLSILPRATHCTHFGHFAVGDSSKPMHILVTGKKRETSHLTSHAGTHLYRRRKYFQDWGASGFKGPLLPFLNYTTQHEIAWLRAFSSSSVFSDSIFECYDYVCWVQVQAIYPCTLDRKNRLVRNNYVGILRNLALDFFRISFVA